VQQLIRRFADCARANTEYGRDGIETLGLIYGEDQKDGCVVNAILIPQQFGSGVSCEMADNAEAEMSEFLESVL
jgi:hypothetical protein